MSGRQSATVDKALRMIAKGATAYAAAKKTGIALSTIYRAQARQRKREAASRSTLAFGDRAELQRKTGLSKCNHGLAIGE